MNAWAYAIPAVAGISLLSLIGAVGFLMKPETFRRSLLLLVSLSVGALLGDAFLHLLPDLARDGGLNAGISSLILAGIGGFFVLEKFLHWHHTHIASEEVLHPIAITNLVGDGMHNFIDGAIIAGAFLVSVPLGWTTTLAVAMHEIPAEMGRLGILVHVGMEMRRALFFNFLSALTALGGAALTLALANSIHGLARGMTAITAGGFVYIAGADLIPELQRETKTTTSLLQLAGIIAGAGIMGLLLLID